MSAPLSASQVGCTGLCMWLVPGQTLPTKNCQLRRQRDLALHSYCNSVFLFISIIWVQILITLRNLKKSIHWYMRYFFQAKQTKKTFCACVFLTLPPQTSPVMSSHWRSSHSQFLPWTRLSPGGWQVHCPHWHWPRKW